jgi:hypothetical protein
MKGTPPLLMGFQPLYAILGLDFLVDYHAVINFAERRIALKIHGDCAKVQFIGNKETTDRL